MLEEKKVRDRVGEEEREAEEEEESVRRDRESCKRGGGREERGDARACDGLVRYRIIIIHKGEKYLPLSRNWLNFSMVAALLCKPE